MHRCTGVYNSATGQQPIVQAEHTRFTSCGRFIRRDLIQSFRCSQAGAGGGIHSFTDDDDDIFLKLHNCLNNIMYIYI